MDNNKLKKIQFKRMLKSYESSLEDLEYLKEMASEIKSEFSSALASKNRHDLFESKAIEEMAEGEENEPEQKESPDRDPLFKKLFRKIVVKCHPDRMDKDLSIKKQSERLEYYELANKANEDNNIALLITIAIKLEIELSEEYYEHINKIEEEAKSIEEEIKNIQGSVAWAWYHTAEEKRDSVLDNYIKHMEEMLLKGMPTQVKILGLGHPRTGTGYTAFLLKSWGLDVGHEVLASDGIVAWPLAIEKGPFLYIKDIANKINPELIIYNVRNPKDSIPSIVYTEDTKEESLNFRIENGVIKSVNRVEMAINSILQWDKLISKKNPDFVYRIEDQSQNLFDFIVSKGFEVEYTPSKEVINARDHESLESLKDEMLSVRPSVKKKINTFCIKYGYDPIF
jgi:hypothetical protein